MMREGFARPFGWRRMVVGLEEAGLVLGAVGLLWAVRRREEVRVSGMEGSIWI